VNKKLLIGVIVALIAVVAIGGYLWLQKKGPQKVYHVGVLSGLDLFFPIVDSFKQKMTTLGYVEGKNIVYDVQKTNFEPNKEAAILKKFVNDKNDLIFGFNTEVALEMKEATKGTTIPVLFANAFTEGGNLIDSVRAPGGNITGVRYPDVDVAVQRLGILHEIVPQAKRIWLPYQKGYPSVPAELEALHPAAKTMGVTLIEFPAENLAALQTELARRAGSGDVGFDAVLFVPESLSTTKAAFDAVAKVTRPRKIPVGGSGVVTADYGTVFAVTVDSAVIGKQAAVLADKILKGTRAGTIPVASPDTILILNDKVAKDLGLNLSQGLLSKASKIIR
jgi:putative tryptophan/tyrosine transport system substrate-binding protein